MYNGLLRFNKHILNELAEGLKHLPNLDGVSKGDSLIINEFCANRGDWITIIDYLEYCALQALCYIEYANFDNQAALNTNLTRMDLNKVVLILFLIKLELIKKLTIIG